MHHYINTAVDFFLTNRTSVYSIIVLIIYCSKEVVQNFIFYYSFFFGSLDYSSFPVKSYYLHKGLESFEANCLMFDDTFEKEIPKVALES